MAKRTTRKAWGRFIELGTWDDLGQALFQLLGFVLLVACMAGPSMLFQWLRFERWVPKAVLKAIAPLLGFVLAAALMWGFVMVTDYHRMKKERQLSGSGTKPGTNGASEGSPAGR